MRRLIRAEFAKLSRNWLLLGILAVIAVFCVIVVGKGAAGFLEGQSYPIQYLNRLFETRFQSISGFESWHAKYVVRAIIGDGMIPLWCGAVLAAFFVGREFEGRTVNAALMRGHTRSRVFCAKLLSYYAAGIAVSLLSLFATLFLFTPDWILRIDGARLLWYFTLRIMCDIGTLSLPFFFAYLCRDLIKTVSFSAAYALILTFLSKGGMGENAVTRVLRKHPINEMQAFMKEGVVAFENVEMLVFVSVGLFVVTTAVAYMMFRRAELK